MGHLKFTTESFITKSKVIHGNKYNYSEVVYRGIRKKVTILCNTCGNKWDTMPQNHLHGNGCRYCQYKKLPQNQPETHEQFIKRCRAVHGERYEYLSEYLSQKKKIKIRCTECGYIFKQRANSHLDGCGCRRCQYKKLPQNQPMAIKEFEERCVEVHNNKYRYYQDYKGLSRKIKICCPLHEDFEQEASSHLLKGYGCPKCDASKGENKIRKWLIEHGIAFEQEKHLDGCRNKFPLRYDFYIQSHNLCIEYDGEQHFYPISAFGGKKYLEKIKHHDEIKSKFCQENKINLLRIPFFKFNKIENTLTKCFIHDQQ